MTRWGRDPVLLILALVLTGLGLVFIFDAGYPRSMQAERGMIPPEFRQQMIVLVPALLLGWFVAGIRPEKWCRASKVLWILSLISLLLPMMPGVGMEMNGAARWVKFPFLPPIQPAEFAKVAVILYLAGVFANRPAWPAKIKPAKSLADFLDRIATTKVKRMLPAVWVLIAVGLIEHEPDLGTAAVVAATAYIMFWLGGASKKTLIYGGVTALVLVAVLVAKQPYRMERIAHHNQRWTETLMDDTGYQTVQSEIAMASGGVIGVGPGAGRAKHVLPAATTDFVNATIAEEFGLLGMLLVLSLIGALTYRLIWLAPQAATPFGSLVLVGTAAWIAVQTCVNVMMANGLLPAIGIPMPFVSSGGSSLVALWIAIGLCQSALAPAVEKKEERLAAHRHRWRNRRTRLSRA